MNETGHFIFQFFGQECEWMLCSANEGDDYEALKVVCSNCENGQLVRYNRNRGELNTEYTQILTDNEELRRNLIQALKQHRQGHPDFMKSPLQFNGTYSP